MADYKIIHLNGVITYIGSHASGDKFHTEMQIPQFIETEWESTLPQLKDFIK